MGRILQFCRKDLPSTFRITQNRGHAKDLLKSLKDGYISKLAPTEIEEKKEDDDEENEQLLLEPIPWFPEEFAWNSNLSRRFIRRSEALQKLHRFLVDDTECGAITRQEAVSMIPPMLLDVKSHHLVLDMCAAPGSKTGQIIEMFHSTCEKGSVPTGAVLANDADHKRCYMLTHQAKRLNTPCVIITNHDASIYPKLHTTDESGNRTQLEFDRVLCDVPCSGDGTIRKNPLLWHRWTPHLGNALHRLQMRILIRGLELLKVGGRLVYSTCSFNPIENEAVIAGVLKETNHSVELVDCSNDLPLLKRIPGKKEWRVFNRNGKEIEEFTEELAQSTNSIKATMFPPSKEVADDINLERCMRIYPHLQIPVVSLLLFWKRKMIFPGKRANAFGKAYLGMNVIPKSQNLMNQRLNQLNRLPKIQRKQ
uniref:tRNA (cytosine(34)-C(5))-methyltransferase n=1 Tax=Clytia hemisphaerica TaxID=252671 RepID=A0A7M5UWS6_9CNID